MRTQSRDTSPEAERVLIGLIRNASIAKRFKSVQAITTFAAMLNLRNIRQQQSGATTEEVALLFVADHHNRTLANNLYKALQQKTTELTIDLLDAITPVIAAFEQSKIVYYMQGTVAASLYGLQRATFAIDLVADLYTKHADVLLEQLKLAYAIDEQVIREAISARTCFDIVHIKSLVKVTVSLSQNHPFEQGIRRRLQRCVLAENSPSICVASPEDIVLTQLKEYQAGGEVADDQWNEILGVLKVQSTNLDFPYLERRASKLNIADLLKQGYVDAGLQTG